MKRTRLKQAGFTLVEIAIVLVIIGLLLGGVLKGQEMIAGAKMKNFVQIWKSHAAAIYGFQDKYRALPGDMKDASTKVPGISLTTKNGNGDGNIGHTDPRSCTANCEGQLVWEHLDKGGFMKTGVDAVATGGAAALAHGYGGYFTSVHNNNGIWLYMHQGYLPIGSMVLRDIAMIDTNYDDGKPGAGSVVEHSYGRTGSGWNPAAPGAYNNLADGAQMNEAISNTWFAAQ